MYIEYVTPQRIADPNFTEYHSKGGDYRPTWLIRTSDWKKVPGAEAIDGYHTLSYCWEQSGEKFQKDDGEYDLIDKGRHRIKAAVVKRSVSNLFRKYQTTNVEYEVVLRQICKDFGIEYLWYDKICIDQTNKDEKHREIKQMHLIYSSACYTIALVPEISIDNPKKFDDVNWGTENTLAKDTALTQMEMSLWFKRSWTLEEVMMSTRILIVGKNTHFWSLADIKQGETIKEYDHLAEGMLGFKERAAKSANQALYFAHFRTSTKEHDKVFALANIFDDMVSIDIDYDTDVSVTMNAFYRQLAEKDLSVMFFGSNLHSYTRQPRFTSTMGSYNLPSWTGVSGQHTLYPVIDIVLDKNCGYTIDDNMQLHIKCRGCTIRSTKYNSDHYSVFKDDERGRKANDTSYKIVTSMDDFDGNEQALFDWSQWCMYHVIGCPTHYWKPENCQGFRYPIVSLSLVEEECDECTLLGVVFCSVKGGVSIDNTIVGYEYYYYLSPIVRKSTDSFKYKVIGAALLKKFQYGELRDNPQEFMNVMFNDFGGEIHDFCIE